MLPVYANAIEEMNHYIKHAFSSGGLLEPEIMREKLPLDTAPFKYAKKLHLNIQELHKDDEIRVAFQALFLFVLRLFIPLKCKKLHFFLLIILVVRKYALILFVSLFSFEPRRDNGKFFRTI